MSSLMESRWAATPETSNVNPLEETLSVKKTQMTEEPNSLLTSRWADTPEPEDEAVANKRKEVENTAEKNTLETVGGAERLAEDDAPAEKDKPEKQGVSEKRSGQENVTGNGEEPKQSVDREAAAYDAAPVGVKEMGEPASVQTAAAEANVEQAVSTARLEPPRLKKRVSWRGRNIVIAIPRLDYEAAGIAKPMSRADVDARMKQLEDEGYNIYGYDLADDQLVEKGSAQVRAIFPAESESRRLPSKGEIKVTLPDLEKWRRYMDWLTEQKLAALGVTLGFDEPAQPSNQDPSISRQSSGQYPPLPFSPPLPTGSGGSMGRTMMGRGHSHAMSVASPVSSMGGAFGHMHRHSTFTGAPMNFEPLGQQPMMSPGIPGVQSFSPQQQFGLSGVPRGGSPAQISALRQDLGAMRGPGSPLSQQIMQQTPQDYSRGLAEDHRRRQHTYSQSMQQPALPPSFMHGAHMRLTPAALPELPEDDDEEQLREAEDDEPHVYVPPQKRVQADTEIAVPTPRGHRHNISEGLEREVVEAEQRQQAASRNYIEVTEEEDRPSITLPSLNGAGNPTSLPPLPKETDPLGSSYPVREATHVRKKSASRFNVAAPAFTFNPGATFKPGQSEFTFGAPATHPPAPVSSNHTRDPSSGSFNVNAPTFKPTTSEFSFSASGPAFKADLPASQTFIPQPGKDNIVDKLPGIFGRIEIPDIIKPARRSKAIPILPPQRSQKSVSGSATEHEDDEGRVAQGEAKRKQQRKAVDDGDDVPLFAEPTPGPVNIMPPPPEKVLGSNDTVTLPALREAEDGVKQVDEEDSKSSKLVAETKVVAEPAQAQAGAEPAKQTHGHKHSTSLSALAKPFQPPNLSSAATESVAQTDEAGFSSISDLEEGEIREETSRFQRPHGHFAINPSDRNAPAPQLEPSFDEIDAVMQQLNAQESEDKEQQSPLRLPSPGSHPMKGVTYLAEWSRSDAPSPSPRRRLIEANGDLDSWQVRQLNKAEEVPTSDWSGMLSPPDEEKLHQRSHFFDNHIANLIGRTLEQRLQPLEENIRSIYTTFSKREKPNDFQLKRRSSNAESDADDEDDLSDEHKQRPISRGRDKRVDQIKSALLEALKEQSPTSSQTAVDIAELHSALADMKVSFARAASANLELDDIRAIVEDTITRQSQVQSQALVTTADEGELTHKRELSELHGRLNETLAGALEEANQRRAIEEREAEARRQLRLAQEELQLLRDSARDDDSKSRAMEEERKDMLHRLDQSEERRRDAEDKLEDSEAQNGALQATLEEYRMSSKMWREDIEAGKREREELENTLSMVRRQAEDNQDSTSGMRRRLEKLHADVATASGQLASEKAMWKSKEEDYRARIESLESQRLVADRERTQIEDELRAVRISALEASEARHTLEHVRASNASLDEMMRKLQGEAMEQQALAARYERQFHEAQESGRAEVHRTRMTLETEVEAANHQVNLVRAELEAEVTKVRTELENVKMEAETAKARHEHLLDQEETVRREALRKVNHSNSVALDEARHKFESTLQDITAQHTRALEHALEDKTRAEAFLNERLALSDAKLQHFQDRVEYLEERLEVTKSAAQAAAQNAQGSKSFAAYSAPAVVPEKVSPQALRESILVLQEQLQERELRIERLQIQVEEEDAAKLKERDTEIAWLRELLAVRNEELTDLVNTISRPNFDRAMVRDTAIRIRANLQMEQQEKERFGRSPQNQVGSALASLTSLATPKAAQLSSAFNKWRSTMESSALKTQQRAGPARTRSFTPSKANASAPPAGYHAGLMTPPASNLRSSPMPEGTNSLSPPRLHPRAGSNASAHSSTKGTAAAPQPNSRKASAASERPNTPLFREHSYDQDAEDSAINMQTFEDDDLDDIADSDGPPAFRSLESELGERSASIETTD